MSELKIDIGMQGLSDDPDAIELSASPFLITGETDDQPTRCFRRRAFPGSTRTYHDVLELHG